MHEYIQYVVINPRRACARVKVLALCVSVCPLILAANDTQGFVLVCVD